MAEDMSGRPMAFITNLRFMRTSFKKKILFIGCGESTHAQGWVDLFQNSDFDIRFFSMPTGSPPDEWPVTTYVTQSTAVKGSAYNKRINLYPSFATGRTIRRFISKFGKLGQSNIAGRFLAQVIRTWQPDIIQTIGIRYASYFLLHVRKAFGVGHIGTWVVQDWGPDLTMDRLLKEHYPKIIEILKSCDGYISDNTYNYKIALSLGIDESRLAPGIPMLASGGIDIEAVKPFAQIPASKRERILVWPKAYNCVQADAYPVIEALKLCWDKIKPCSIIMAAVSQEEVRLWLETLPEEIRRYCRINERIERSSFLQHLGNARVMLSPTLSDGMPNILAESMSMGTMPIVSPLLPIKSIVTDENVIFARNLYPDEIAGAIAKAMNDDSLIDRCAAINIKLAAKIFCRKKTQKKVLQYYESLLAK